MNRKESIHIPWLGIQPFKMLLRYLQGFVSAFFDSNRRYNDYKFRKAVVFIQLKMVRR